MTKKMFHRAFIFSFLFILCSCSKNDDRNIDCLPVLPPFVVNFNILNERGEDVFFGENPEYIIDNFNIVQKVGEEQLDIPFSINDKEVKFLELAVPASKQDTCYLVFSTNEMDTLVYFGSKMQDLECMELRLDSIHFNNERVERDVNTGIYSLHK